MKQTDYLDPVVLVAWLRRMGEIIPAELGVCFPVEPVQDDSGTQVDIFDILVERARHIAELDPSGKVPVTTRRAAVR